MIDSTHNSISEKPNFVSVENQIDSFFKIKIVYASLTRNIVAYAHGGKIDYVAKRVMENVRYLRYNTDDMMNNRV